MSTFCNNTNMRDLQCYNSYQDSQYIGPQSHFTCTDTCVHWKDMCQGVSWCEGDLEVCNPAIRCPPNAGQHHIKSSLVPGHYFCFKKTENTTNGIFDAIDRSDESEIYSDGVKYVRDGCHPGSYLVPYYSSHVSLQEWM